MMQSAATAPTAAQDTGDLAALFARRWAIACKARAGVLTTADAEEAAALDARFDDGSPTYAAAYETPMIAAGAPHPVTYLH